MSTEAHILIIVLAAAVIVFIVHLVRSRQLRAKYSVLWFSIGLALAVLAIFPDLLVGLSDLFGIDYPPATFMLLALSFLLLLGAALLLGAVAARRPHPRARRGARVAPRRSSRSAIGLRARRRLRLTSAPARADDQAVGRVGATQPRQQPLERRARRGRRS